MEIWCIKDQISYMWNDADDLLAKRYSVLSFLIEIEGSSPIVNISGFKK